MSMEHLLPWDIERESFRIIGEELKERGICFPKEIRSVMYRVIHTTADFEYADTMTFTEEAVEKGKQALAGGAHIVTDTNMARAGINRRALEALGGELHCFMAEPDVAEEARKRQITRASVSMERAAKINAPLIFAIGNAPTALFSLDRLIRRGFRPALIIAVPVGFVNVVSAKEQILLSGVPAIVNRGRKGGSNVAAAICNALLYELYQR